MRSVNLLVVSVILAVSCSSSSTVDLDGAPSPSTDSTTSTESRNVEVSEEGPGGYGFDRSDPDSGIQNIMDAFATDRATATCIFDAWGDVANLPPAELTPELMTFEVCGTSIFQLMTGDPRFTGGDG